MPDTAHINLVCWACDATFTMQRRRGQYPTRCEACRDIAPRMRQLERAARRHGLNAHARRHPRLGWVCQTRTPWHQHPVHLRDRLDLQYLLAELAHDAPTAVAA